MLDKDTISAQLERLRPDSQARFFNFGIERSITKDMTIAVNYVGDQSHFDPETAEQDAGIQPKK